MVVHTRANTVRAARTANGLFPSLLLALPRLVVVAVLAAAWVSGCFVFAFWLGRLRSPKTRF